MRDQRPLAVALMGPTASGKTALAVEWAQHWGGEIVSVDSALVYRRMNIGTAKPDAATLAQARHHLLDLREPQQTYSAADFARDALAAMQDIQQRGRLPILAGGTGLYFQALLEGLSPMPEADPALRAQLQAEAGQYGWASLHGELARVDPLAAARIHATDPQRIVRALEVWRLTGRRLSDWQAQPSGHRLPFRVLKLVIAPQHRAVLHARIAQRFDAMLAAGFLDEVRALRADPLLHAELPSMRAVGYRQAWAHLEGDTDAVQFREQAIAATRQLAKRQLTWLRGELDACWFDPEQQLLALNGALSRFLQ
ncbi:MAG: tRNA (adenosine(37)-N6)-dimethylallyltransferase MiaA [Gammaproteobacteria bacterium HGW-Gammaproteobacteria-4]|jgi:tRNA dimethylallyltransferase|nr:MAG: tRNA (adenosine(37)-N6)-dimethylallyltransferase MiaA [Gammaproteobacteria bacterium HGW-Gammaproteobacteria-4]